ncbi:PREDICTED: uncharacterized protein LOC104771827 [Camelina sativa]|uniref:Uncharacterized protein LOC104771827 n=1 Tax=Camelina sativa TaxID=90675 RepID=A0ABM0Y364_CAMSA|nr:PREDICTED: uncharacterized protein LOC104771827 [Camelina sativa]
MEEKKLDFDAPFLSVRRIPTKPEDPSESENTETKTTTTRRRKVKDSCHETEHESLIRLLQDRSFDHVMEPSSVPFTWEQTPGKPKDQHTVIEELDLIKSLEMVSSAASFSANCSSNGVSEFENNGDGDRSSNVSRDDDVILEYRDLIMSRFLLAAEAIAMKEKKEASRVKEERKKKQNLALQRVSMAINQDMNIDNDDDDVDDHNATVYSKDPKKAQLGFSPWLCSKNSMDVLNPVLSRIKTCQDIGVKSGNIINPKPLDSVYKTKSTSPRILKSNKVMSESQELYATPRFSKDISKISLPKAGETLRIQGNLSRLQRTTDQNQRHEIRFLVEEVKRRSNINKCRAQNISIPQPPLPKTPSESWLCRTVPRSSAASSVVSGQAARFRKKMEEKTNSQSIKWETIVKRSYKHHDHVRYSEDLIIVHPSR